MAKVAREMVERAGLNVEKLVEELVSTAGDEAWFAELLGEGPSGHLHREEISPFVSKFLR